MWQRHCSWQGWYYLILSNWYNLVRIRRSSLQESILRPTEPKRRYQYRADPQFPRRSWQLIRWCEISEDSRQWTDLLLAWRCSGKHSYHRFRPQSVQEYQLCRITHTPDNRYLLRWQRQHQVLCDPQWDATVIEFWGSDGRHWNQWWAACQGCPTYRRRRLSVLPSTPPSWWTGCVSYKMNHGMRSDDHIEAMVSYWLQSGTLQTQSNI